MAGGEPWLEAVRHYLGGRPDGGVRVELARRTSMSRSVPGPVGLARVAGTVGRMRSKACSAEGAWAWCSRRLTPLYRNVAIKVLSASLATCGAARRRFLREARAAAAVAHEHVVSVFAVVESAGLPFLVMEYVPGRSLQDRLDKEGPLALPEILRIGMQTAAGLAAAHAQGWSTVTSSRPISCWKMASSGSG